MSKNTALGWNSLANQNFAGGNSMDGYNVAIGGGALGFTNPTNTTNGIHNSALGGLAGLWNKTGYDLTFLGFQADICPTCSTTTIQNSTAIGANSIIRNSNNLILGGNTLSNGNNDVNVGIGLSNDVSGPQSKL